MPSIGERIQLDITGLTHDGHGVGRYQGLAVFVPGALPEETVEATVTEVRPRFARGSLVRITTESGHRVSPACPLAAQGWCGGCGLSHLSYEAQLRHKTTRVKEALARIGSLPGVEVKDCLPSPSPVAYRNKVQYAVTLVDKEWRLGLMETGTHTAHPAEECPAAHPAIREVARQITVLLNKLGAPDRPGTGTLAAPSTQPAVAPIRHVVIRYAAATGEAMGILVTPSRNLPIWSRLSERLVELCPDVKSVVHLVNPRPSGTVLAGERVRVEGRPYIEDELLGLRFRISPESFYQINLVQTANLYGTALEYAGLGGQSENAPSTATSPTAPDSGPSVLDVYCGIGTITLLAARHAREAVGIESIPAAVEDAARNAALNNLHNTRFLAGPAERLLPRLAHDGFRPEVVIVDPPRAGVEKAALDAIIAIAPPRLVYVSCDPESLARDLGRLSAADYTIRLVQPVDMFPQTSHTEVVALVTRG